MKDWTTCIRHQLVGTNLAVEHTGQTWIVVDVFRPGQALFECAHLRLSDAMAQAERLAASGYQTPVPNSIKRPKDRYEELVKLAQRVHELSLLTGKNSGHHPECLCVFCDAPRLCRNPTAVD